MIDRLTFDVYLLRVAFVKSMNKVTVMMYDACIVITYNSMNIETVYL
jgi:hypothetical protein